LDSPATQVTSKELELLLKYSKGARVIAEIGCFEGSSAAALAVADPTVERLYSVDPFFRGRLGICYGELIARLHCRRSGATAVRFKKGFSFDVAPAVQDTIDFLFIDADHSYEAVSRDWKDWVPKLRKGGIVALHDCKPRSDSHSYLGSMKFYDWDISRMSDVQEIDSVDSLVVLRVC
jgi:predicted O-methyltransferase YrrM